MDINGASRFPTRQRETKPSSCTLDSSAMRPLPTCAASTSSSNQSAVCSKLGGLPGPTQYSLPPEKLTEIYLGHLYKHIKATLELELSASVVNSIPIDYVIAVPAIWSDAVRTKAQRAAEAAGFGASHDGRAIYMVSEPVRPSHLWLRR